MSVSGIIVLILILISVASRLSNAARKEQAKKGNPAAGSGLTPSGPGQSAIPYAPNATPQAARPVSKGFEGFKEFLKEIENEGREMKGAQLKQQKSKPARPQPAKKPAPPSGGAEEGAASQEGEDTMHISHRNPGKSGDTQADLLKAAAIFANGSDLRRAVVMSEVLGKPVSLRKRGAR